MGEIAWSQGWFMVGYSVMEHPWRKVRCSRGVGVLNLAPDLGVCNWL